MCQAPPSCAVGPPFPADPSADPPAETDRPETPRVGIAGRASVQHPWRSYSARGTIAAVAIGSLGPWGGAPWRATTIADEASGAHRHRSVTRMPTAPAAAEPEPAAGAGRPQIGGVGRETGSLRLRGRPVEERRDRRARPRHGRDPGRGEQPAVGHLVDGIDPIVIDLVRDRGRGRVRGRSSGRGSRSPSRGPDGAAPRLRTTRTSATPRRRMPGSSTSSSPSLDPHVLDVGQEDERAERDRRDRLGRRRACSSTA